MLICIATQFDFWVGIVDWSNIIIQEFAGGVYPSSPTYILYAPMYPSTALSPGGVPLSPALSNPGTHVHQVLRIIIWI